MTFSEKIRISREDYEQHDCHFSGEDGCAACTAWESQEGSIKTCPEGICDGSGLVQKLAYDSESNQWYSDGEKDCLCALKEDDQYDPDSNY